VQRLRGVAASGNANPPWLGTIVIDAGSCGQDPYDLINHAQAVYDADPQHNVVFSIHVYGMWCDLAAGVPCDQAPGWGGYDLPTLFDAMAATGLPFLIGEFGPGADIGPSPTMLTPGTVITNADARNFGWIAWAWDDKAGDWSPPGRPYCNPSGEWFNLVIKCGDGSGYSTSLSSDLTTFGQEVVENPTYGLKATAEPATVF
jgi:aryl-phospho-beta-D-glucosidase BglC (GH1 family)